MKKPRLIVMPLLDGSHLSIGAGMWLDGEVEMAAEVMGRVVSKDGKLVAASIMRGGNGRTRHDAIAETFLRLARGERLPTLKEGRMTWEKLDGVLTLRVEANTIPTSTVRTAERIGGLLRISSSYDGWSEVYRFASSATAARNGEDWVYQLIVPDRKPVRAGEWTTAVKALKKRGAE